MQVNRFNENEDSRGHESQEDQYSSKPYPVPHGWLQSLLHPSRVEPTAPAEWWACHHLSHEHPKARAAESVRAVDRFRFLPTLLILNNASLTAVSMNNHIQIVRVLITL